MIKTSFSISGRLTHDAEIKQTKVNQLVSLNVAVNIRVPVREDGKVVKWEDKPEFYRLTKFVKNSESIAKIAKKGEFVVASGEIRQRIYEKDGKKETVYDFIVDDGALEFPNAKYSKKEEPAQSAPADEEIPF